jgi:hypothetical protein
MFQCWKSSSFLFTFDRFFKDSVNFYWESIFLKDPSHLGTFFRRLKHFLYYLISTSLWDGLFLAAQLHSNRVFTVLFWTKPFFSGTYFKTRKYHWIDVALLIRHFWALFWSIDIGEKQVRRYGTQTSYGFHRWNLSKFYKFDHFPSYLIHFHSRWNSAAFCTSLFYLSRMYRNMYLFDCLQRKQRQQVSDYYSQMSFFYLLYRSAIVLRNTRQ